MTGFYCSLDTIFQCHESKEEGLPELRFSGCLRMICVECGLKLASESLYVEYSERNIKLMRCVSNGTTSDHHLYLISLTCLICPSLSISFSLRLSMCSSHSQESCLQVADKYIEYELLLVSIDLILLREQAYRHILFNRSLLNRASIVSNPLAFISHMLFSSCLYNRVLISWYYLTDIDVD